MLSRRKTIIFSILPALALLLLLALVEMCLRIFVPSLASPLAVPVTADGTEWLQIDRRYLTKFFASDVILVPEFQPTMFRKQKQPGTFRVICLGESSMFGTPYPMNATIPAIVRSLLRRNAPGREIEVINLGAAAINTSVIAEIAPQVAEFDPDLILIYTGHNEFYGPGGVGASWLEKHVPFVTGLRRSILNLRLAALVNKLFTRSPRETSGDPNMMKAVSHGQEVELASEESERIFQHFEDHLNGILETFHEKKIPVIVSDIVSNLEFPPFVAPPVTGIPDCAVAFAQQGPALLPRLQAARTAQPRNAAVAYWMGRCFLALGQRDSARTLLEEARDLDLLKFRAPQKINDIIRRVASAHSTPCVSSDSLFSSISPNGIPDNTLFWEHLHPNVRGYFGIAQLFIDRMASIGSFPGTLPGRVFSEPYNADRLAISWLELAYADLSMKQLTSRWPFTGYQRAPVVLSGADPELVSIATSVYTRAMSWEDGCYRTALVFRRLGRPGDALTTYRALFEANPRNAFAHYLSAGLDRDISDFRSAEKEYRASITISPADPLSRVELGLMLINEGRFDDALAELDAAIRITGDKGAPALRATALYGLSAAHANKGNYARALELVEASIALSPNYAPAVALRDGLRRTLRSPHP